MKWLFIILILVSGCSEDKTFVVENSHVLIEGQLKEDAELEVKEVKAAVQVVVSSLDKK